MVNALFEGKRISSRNLGTIKMANTETGVVVRPTVGKVVTPLHPESFVYVLRDDTDYIARGLCQRLAVSPKDQLAEREVKRAYETFLGGLFDAFLTAAKPRGPMELHVYPAQAVEAQRIKFRVPGSRVVSLDPLCEQPDAIHLGLSRWYYPGGRNLAGEGFRPGFASVPEQFARIRAVVGAEPVTLIEDDMYTGETLATTVADLLSAGINVRQVAVGVQICQNAPTVDGVETAAAVRYELDRDRPLEAQIDLGDPRDYLIGLSGLVILLADNGEDPVLGRAPYILPFVKPSDRASFPAESDWQLSITALQLSQRFYGQLMNSLGKEICIAHCDPEFATFVAHELGTGRDETMVGFIGYVLEHANQIAERFF
jgi:hypothetical protein